MLKLLIKGIASISLSRLHKIGARLGVFSFQHGKKLQAKVYKNLELLNLPKDLPLKSMRQAGMLSAETAWIWGNDNETICRHCQRGEGFEDLEKSVKENRSIIMMAPHVGGYEVLPIFFYETLLKQYKKTFTVLYREPHRAIIRPFVRLSRTREGMTPASADLSGVRVILKSMKNGGILGCLPDQVPGRGEGVWVPFLGKLAYTMTFPMKIARQFNSDIYIACAQRLEEQGWCIHVRKLDIQLTGDRKTDATAMNKALEIFIRQYPDQYIWNYNRYKTPKGVKGPKEE